MFISLKLYKILLLPQKNIIAKVEKTYQRTTRMIKVVSGLRYKKRSGKLKLFNLEERWLTQDTTKKNTIMCHEKEE